MICLKCGTTMCELSDEKVMHGMTLSVPNGTFICYRCEKALATASLISEPDSASNENSAKDLPKA